tara:strand:+ start:132 stop:473 length:342 start_codon:yes stop_codon:yes gene_type:complete
MMRKFFNFRAKKILLAFVVFSVVVLNMTAVIAESAGDNIAGDLISVARLDHPATKNNLANEHDDVCHYPTHHLFWVEHKTESISWMESEEVFLAVSENRMGLVSSGLYRPPKV